MDIKDKKKEVVQALQSTHDEQLIEDVYELIHSNDVIENISLEILPDELQHKIRRAVDDYKNGRYITHDQMKLKIEQWLTS